METTTARSVSDRIQDVRGMINALGRDPAEWTDDVLPELQTLHWTIDLAMGRAVDALRTGGSTDADIAAALQTTRQAVSKRWPGGGRYVGAAGRYRKPTVDQEAQQPC
jgi:hypothetical protein